MTVVTLDGIDEEQFRRSIETRLRHGLADGAIQRLRGLLAPYAGPDGILPERFMTVASGDLHLFGWEGLADALQRLDRPGRPITALSIAFGWPEEEAAAADPGAPVRHHVEVSYYTDESFPFSQSARDDLLEGYSYHGCTWAGDCVATETTLTVSGIDDLQQALAELEAHLLSTPEPDEDGIRAGSLGACLLSALLFKAVGERIERDGLPRPLCVTAGSSGVYPYFDAPVVGMPADAIKAAEDAEANAANDPGIPGPRYSSLLMTSIPRARKRAVLVLEENSDEMAQRIASLRGHGHGEQPEPSPEDPAHEAHGAPSDQSIIPVANGPLLAKKQPRVDFDFREMLSPAAPRPVADEQVEHGFAAPDPDPEEFGEFNDDPAVQQDQQPVEPLAPPALEPGFSLYGSETQDRLDALLARHLPREEQAPPTPPEPLAEVVAQPITEAVAWREEPVAPLPLPWRDDEPVSQPIEARDEEQETPRETLSGRLVMAIARAWSGLHGWLFGQR